MANTVSGDGNIAVQASEISNSTIKIGGKSAASVTDQCLQSLAFREMYFRSGDKDRVAGTGDWILKYQHYREWQRDAGMLWTKGRAGCGKTILMNHIVSEAEKSSVSDHGSLVISFFFHRPGHHLQQSAVGVYRSLLHQMLVKQKILLSDFMAETGFAQRFRDRALRARSGTGQSQSFASSAIASCGVHLGATAGSLFIWLLSTKAKIVLLRPGFAGFTTPQQILDVGLGTSSVITIGVEEENREDLRAFLNNHFQKIPRNADGTTTADLRAIQDRLLLGAGSVFQWLTWISRQASEIVEAGDEDVEYVLEMIDKCPADLSEVYETSLQRIFQNEVDLALRLFEWVALAKRPLSLEDLRYAICLEPNKRQHSFEELTSLKQYWCRDAGLLGSCACRISEGLIKEATAVFVEPCFLGFGEEYAFTCQLDRTAFVEPACVGYSTKVCKILQSDHESVYDFVAWKGLQMLSIRLTATSLPTSMAERQLSMAARCLAFLGTKEVAEYSYSREVPLRVLDGNVAEYQGVRDPSVPEPPLALYAASQWFEHLKPAELEDITVCDIGALLWSQPGVLWPVVAAMQQFARCRYCSENHAGTSVMHIFCGLRFSRLLDFLLDPPNVSNEPLNIPMKQLRDSCFQKIDAQDKGGKTPLALVAEQGQLPIINILLRHGADINARTSENLTPLQLAALSGQSEIVQSLLAWDDVDVDAKDGEDRTALSHAVIRGNVAFIKLLAEASELGVHSEEVSSNVLGFVGGLLSTPLTDAYFSGSKEVLQAVLACPILDAELRGGFHYFLDMFIVDPVFSKQYPYNKEKTRLLIESGKLALDLKDEHSRTPLAIAARHGKTVAVKLLLATNKVDVEAKDNNGNTPLMIATVKNQAQIMRLLLTIGRAPPSEPDTVGRTPLLVVIAHACPEIVRLLVTVGQVSASQPDPTTGRPAIEWARTLQSAPDRQAERVAIYGFLREHVN